MSVFPPPPPVDESRYQTFRWSPDGGVALVEPERLEIPEWPPVTPTPSAAPAAASDDRPRPIRSLGPEDRREFLVAAVGGIVLAALLRAILDWQHPVTLAIWAVIGFMVLEWLLVRDRAGSLVATDRLVTVAVWTSGGVAIGVLGWMLAYVVSKGIGGIDWEFFTEDLSDVGPLNPGGGSLHAIIGTLQQTLMATVVAVPLGILTAVYLHELKGRGSALVRFTADAMSGLPSIVAGLIVYTLWVSSAGQGFSGLACSMALVIVMLPIITRTAEEMLRTVSPGLRESSLALGAPEWSTVVRIVLPTARAGLVTASILGVARVVGETAPALLTAFGSASVNANPFEGQQANLPLFVYQLIRQPNAVQIQRAWAGALVLVTIVILLFIAARVISGRGAKRRGASR